MNTTFRSILATLGVVLLVALAVVGAFALAGVQIDAHNPLHALGLTFGVGVIGLTFLQNDDAIKYLIAIGFLDAGGGLKYQVKAKVADYIIATVTDPSGTLFTNRGAVGAVVFTLPAPAQNLTGTYYDFLVVAAQSLKVKTATADTLITDNDATADDIAASRVGTMFRAICDGTSWACNVTTGIPAAAFAQTATVTT